MGGEEGGGEGGREGGGEGEGERERRVGGGSPEVLPFWNRITNSKNEKKKKIEHSQKNWVLIIVIERGEQKQKSVEENQREREA